MKCLISYDIDGDEILQQPRETNVTPTGTVRHLLYGEIVEIESINAERTVVTLKDALGRTYEPLGGKLRLYPFGDKLNEDLVIEDLTIDGRDTLGALLENGIVMRYADDVTVRRVTIREFANQGIFISWSRYVTIDQCRLLNIFEDFNDFGQGYAVEVDASRHVTVSTCEFLNCRYGCSFASGTMDATGSGLEARFIFRSGAICDIHGGDCLNILFENATAVYAGINLGNTGWKRGADNVEVRDCTTAALAVMGSMRNVLVTNWHGTRLSFLSTAVDDGDGGSGSGGYMNATGANYAGTKGADFESCTVHFRNNEYYTSERKVPIQLAGGPLFRGEGVRFTDCSISVDYAGNTSQAFAADQTFDTNFPSDFTFTDSTISTLQSAIDAYTFTLFRNGPFHLELNKVTLVKTSSSQDSLIHGQNGSTSITALLTCTSWTYAGGPTVVLDATNYSSHVVYLVPPQIKFASC